MRKYLVIFFYVSVNLKKNVKLDSFPVDAPGQLDVDDVLGVDGAEARVLEEADEVDLAGLLERRDRPNSESASRSGSHRLFREPSAGG